MTTQYDKSMTIGKGLIVTVEIMRSICTVVDGVWSCPTSQLIADALNDLAGPNTVPSHPPCRDLAQAHKALEWFPGGVLLDEGPLPGEGKLAPGAMY